MNYIARCAPPDSVENRFRVGRFRLFRQMVDQVLAEKGTCRILDLGGTLEYWQQFGSQLDWNKVNVYALNLSASETNHPGFTSVVGDARRVSDYDNLSFDIVHSNSVIEHVGRWRIWFRWRKR